MINPMKKITTLTALVLMAGGAHGRHAEMHDPRAWIPEFVGTETVQVIGVNEAKGRCWDDHAAHYTEMGTEHRFHEQGLDKLRVVKSDPDILMKFVVRGGRDADQACSVSVDFYLKLPHMPKERLIRAVDGGRGMRNDIAEWVQMEAIKTADSLAMSWVATFLYYDEAVWEAFWREAIKGLEETIPVQDLGA